MAAKKTTKTAAEPQDFDYHTADLGAIGYGVVRWYRDQFYRIRFLQAAREKMGSLPKSQANLVSQYVEILQSGSLGRGGIAGKAIKALELNLNKKEKYYLFFMWLLQRPELPFGGDIGTRKAGGTTRLTGTKYKDKDSARGLLLKWVEDQYALQMNEETFFQHIQVPIDYMIFYASTHGYDRLTFENFTAGDAGIPEFERFATLSIGEGGGKDTMTRAYRDLFEKYPEFQPPGYDPLTFYAKGESASESKRMWARSNAIIATRGNFKEFSRFLLSTGFWANNPFDRKDFVVGVTSQKTKEDAVAYTYDDFLDFRDKFFKGENEDRRALIWLMISTGLREEAASCALAEAFKPEPIVRDALGNEFVEFNALLGFDLCKRKAGKEVVAQKTAPTVTYVPRVLYNKLMLVYAENRKKHPNTPFIFGENKEAMVKSAASTITNKKKDPDFLKTLSSVNKHNFIDYQIKMLRATWATAYFTGLGQNDKAVSAHLESTWGKDLATGKKHYSGAITLPEAIRLIQEVPLYISPLWKHVYEAAEDESIRMLPGTEKAIVRGITEETDKIRSEIRGEFQGLIDLQTKGTDQEVAALKMSLSNLQQQLATLQASIPYIARAPMVPIGGVAEPRVIESPVHLLQQGAFEELNKKMDMIQSSLKAIQK